MNLDQQRQFARDFTALHRSDPPLVLVNVWDVASAKAIAATNAKALATSSGAVAAAHGYKDGQLIPLATVVTLIGQITAQVNVPLTVDFEAGYSDDPTQAAAAVRRIVDAGAIGINLEDGLSGAGKGLVSADQHCRKIDAIRRMASALELPLYINARIDTYLIKVSDGDERLNETVARAKRYLEAGASGIFVPGASSAADIGTLARQIKGPLNVMAMPDFLSVQELGKLGVARISLGAWPIRAMMQHLQKCAQRLASTGDLTTFSA